MFMFLLTWLNMDFANLDVSCFREFAFTPASMVTLAMRPMYLENRSYNAVDQLYVHYGTFPALSAAVYFIPQIILRAALKGLLEIFAVRLKLSDHSIRYCTVVASGLE